MNLILGLTAVALATAIIFGYLIFIWWLDRYEREPFWLVMLTFAWGALGGTFLGCTLSLIMSVPMSAIVSAAYADFTMAVVIAPLTEELTKGLIFLALLFTSHLDNETDGLIYGAATGLGFACVENLLYFASAAAVGPEAFYITIVMRTLFTALVHTISSALLGYAIGYVRHRELWPWRWTLPLVGFALAVLNHALWNLAASLGSTGLVSDTIAVVSIGSGLLLVIGMSVVMFALCQFSLLREQRIIKKYLCDEAKQGTLPRRHAEIIPYWLKRRKRGWLPPHIPHEDYLQAATLLAFRRYQADTAAEKYRPQYLEEVQEKRQKLLSLAAPG